jgi:hypothetical protein
MAATIVLARSFFRYPAKHKLHGRRVSVSSEKEFRAWFKRQKRFKGRRPKKEHWLYTLDSEVSKTRKGIKIGEDWHRIQLQHKMTEVEKILPLSSFSERHIRDTFNKQEVFRNLWANWGGIIRIVVSGTVDDGRRVKEIIHLGYHKEHWESQERGRGKRKMSGRELFRRWLVSSVATNLRRRGLRLSNPKESQERITRLRQDLMKLQGQTEYVGYMHPEKMGGHVQQIIWKARAIKQQQRTKQLRGATLRIEKLV